MIISAINLNLMESFYLVVLILLGVLAISDLIVGVSNDAVNFLNSAIGSKVAPLKVILIIASLGVLVGATFSSGLMEIARKGIFHPESFAFHDVMIIFLAVMVTDIILLDLFNTYGLPTSTTVSIVFELLGAAFAVALYKIYLSPDEGLTDMVKYINSSKALAIITGILLSVFIAFFTGLLIQFLSRLLFSFKYVKTLRYFGSLWGAIAISTITYFIFIKGAKGASFIDESTVDWIKQNTFYILLYSMIGWTILLQILRWVFKLNVLKMIVLVGTFALAMSFAGNDLVNFIGVPLAGLSSFQEFIKSGDSSMLMSSLAAPVKANTYLLLLAGLIMVVTLWTSRKARSVTKTEVNLGRQYEGYERFGSTGLSRGIVRMVMGLNGTLGRFTPPRMRSLIQQRFQEDSPKSMATATTTDDNDAPAFDMIRASVNLVVASALIALGTSLKLPLSTTYVTFMVAMGTSLADRAWGRESAVYRVTGVFTVIGGWFMTALTAFLISGIFAVILMFTGWVGMIVLVTIAVSMLIRTRILFKKRESAEEASNEFINGPISISQAETFDKATKEITKTIRQIPQLLKKVFDGLQSEDLRALRKADKEINKYYKERKTLKDNLPLLVERLSDDNIEVGHYYIQIIDYLKQISNSVLHIGQPTFDHISNQHKGTSQEQIDDLYELQERIKVFLDNIGSHMSSKYAESTDSLSKEHSELLALIDKLKKRQIKRIKNSESGIKVSMLYLNILDEMKNIVLLLMHTVKSHRDFVIYLQNLSKK
jgi:phosphate/sulfate permease